MRILNVTFTIQKISVRIVLYSHRKISEVVCTAGMTTGCFSCLLCVDLKKRRHSLPNIRHPHLDQHDDHVEPLPKLYRTFSGTLSHLNQHIDHVKSGHKLYRTFSGTLSQLNQHNDHILVESRPKLYRTLSGSILTKPSSDDNGEHSDSFKNENRPSLHIEAYPFCEYIKTRPTVKSDPVSPYGIIKPNLYKTFLTNDPNRHLVNDSDPSSYRDCCPFVYDDRYSVFPPDQFPPNFQNTNMYVQQRDKPVCDPPPPRPKYHSVAMSSPLSNSNYNFLAHLPDLRPPRGQQSYPYYTVPPYRHFTPIDRINGSRFSCFDYQNRNVNINRYMRQYLEENQPYGRNRKMHENQTNSPPIYTPLSPMETPISPMFSPSCSPIYRPEDDPYIAAASIKGRATNVVLVLLGIHMQKCPHQHKFSLPSQIR